MPIYEYLCEGCGKSFEKLMRGTEPEPPCPACGHQGVARQLSTFAAHAHGAPGASPDLPMCPSGGVCPTPGMCGRN